MFLVKTTGFVYLIKLWQGEVSVRAYTYFMTLVKLVEDMVLWRCLKMSSHYHFGRCVYRTRIGWTDRHALDFRCRDQTLPITSHLLGFSLLCTALRSPSQEVWAFVDLSDVQQWYILTFMWVIALRSLMFLECGLWNVVLNRQYLFGDIYENKGPDTPVISLSL